MAATPSLTGLHDIFYHILEHLTPDPKAPNFGSFDETADSKSARKALARLARTHSSFTQPALVVMWRSLPSQEPLEHLLCVVGIAQGPPKQKWVRRPLELCGTPATHEAGWIRFQEYASRVREIIIDPFVDSVNRPAKLVEDTFWCQLSSAFGDTPIFPRLKGATLRSVNSLCPIDMGALRLVNPSIRELGITFPRASKGDLKRLGRGLTDCFSSMQNLEVLSMEVSDPAPFLDMESLPRLHPRLRYLKLDRSAHVELNHLLPLSALPNLEYLSISLGSWEPPKLPITFPGLHSLTVSCYEFYSIGTLIAHVDAPRLRTFSISEKHEDSNNMSREFSNHLSTLVAKCPSLTAFQWSSEQVWGRKVGYIGNRRSGAPLTELVASLLSHRAMRSFSVLVGGPVVPYAPADFRTIAEAWPDLETFHLYDSGKGDCSWAERHADLESVLSFARYCPRLCSLRIRRVKVDSDAFGDLAHRHPAPHWLRELCVDRVLCSGEQDHGDRRRVKVAVQFRGLMEKVFPSAVIRVW